MSKESRNFRLQKEVLDLLKELSERSDKEFGTHLSQAQIVEKAVREMAALRPHQKRSK